MDITVVFRCLKRWCGFIFATALLLLLSSCPGENADCNDLGSIAEIPDLMVLTPEQSTYNMGDEVVLSMEIPVLNDYFGVEQNVYSLSGDESAILVMAFDDLFVGNEIIFIKGSQSDYPNWFNMPYDPISETYQLEVRVILNVPGFYSSSSMGTVTVQGNDYCNRFRIDTTFPWNLTNGRIEFNVIE